MSNGVKPFILFVLVSLVLGLALLIYFDSKLYQPCEERGGVWTRAGCLAKECIK